MTDKEIRYSREDRRVRSKIQRYLSGKRKNNKICTKAEMVSEYERDFGISLIQRDAVNEERGLYMYEIAA